MRNTISMRGDGLLLQAADRQYASAQRDLARHRDVAAHGNSGEGADDRRGNRNARRWPVLWSSASRYMDVEVAVAMELAVDSQRGCP